MTSPWKRIGPIALTLIVALPMAACGDDDDDVAADEPAEDTVDGDTELSIPEGEVPSEVAVQIAEPADGATVASPVVVKMAAVGFAIEPAGDGAVNAGRGHYHVMVDTACVEPGQVIPSTPPSHNHFGKAQTEATLELTPGEHTLCLQAGDGAHTALDLTDEIKITVS